MAVVSAARPLLRPSSSLPSRLVLPRSAPRRFQSTSSTSAAEAAAKAKQTASELTAKAAAGLSRVATLAGPAVANAATAIGGLTRSLDRVGGPAGKVIKFVERQTPFVVYYSRVGLELGKLVFRGQKMTPPSLDVFQSYYQNAWKQLQTPSKLLQSPATLLQQARSLKPAQMAAGGVLAAELLGFFTVGEIIGRFKLIGYHGGQQGAHH